MMIISFESKSLDKELLKIAHIRPNSGNEMEVYFKFPKTVEADLTDRADPFVYALSFLMMKEGGDIHVEGKVSQSVVSNIVMFSRIWNIWSPKNCKVINVLADIVEDDFRPNNRKLITAFSGGLDASYTAYKYKKNLDPYFSFDFDKSIMLLGADIPIEDKPSFELAYSAAKRMTDDLGIELVVVETNIRKFLDSWSFSFGSVIAGCLSFFSRNYFYGAASDDSVHHYATPWGMNPITDQYLSNDTFRFISDGHEHSRTDRAYFIRDWKVGLENLRVCWSNDDKSKNCGYCEKCVRTKMNFKVVGVPHLPSMPSDVTFAELQREGLIRDPHNILYFSEIYDYALRNKTLSTEWLNVLKQQLMIWRGSKVAERPKGKLSMLWRNIKKSLKEFLK